MALNRVWIASPNYSSRGGTGVRLIVLHTAEGALTIESLGNFFANPSSEVSSHTGIDDKPNTVGEYVKRGNKAWTQGNANPYSVAAELCAFAAWTPADWDAHPVMLENAAKWVAEEAAAFGIPLMVLDDAQAQGGGRGVTQHENLGAAGGGHWDCGPSFPIGRVVEMAGGQPGQSAPSAPTAPAPGGPAPPWPGVYLRDFTEDPSARTWQQQMSNRGWSIDVDGMYGPASAEICRSFQAEKGLGVDGIVGPDTWAASWTAAVT
jgi:hypothetical protein